MLSQLRVFCLFPFSFLFSSVCLSFHLSANIAFYIVMNTEFRLTIVFLFQSILLLFPCNFSICLQL